jgi:hypothetical protein
MHMCCILCLDILYMYKLSVKDASMRGGSLYILYIYVGVREVADV